MHGGNLSRGHQSLKLEVRITNDKGRHHSRQGPGTDTVDPIVAAAQAAFAVRLKDSADVSENTKNAQAIAKAWRGVVHELDPDRFQIEAMVTPELDQKIDIVDSETACAYEFKVSGKNAWAEFYKDVVKVVMWNAHRKKKLSCLVFIT